MKLTFLGADHEVTGSLHYLQACGKNIVIDCGMEQGTDEFVNQPLPVSANAVDILLLTHAHIDHSGRIPMLCKQGFSGKIYATEATTDLCGIMLRDSAHIQEFEAEWRNRKAKRSGEKAFEPMYTMDDALAAIKLFEPQRYGEIIEVCPGVSIRFTDVGHLLGSAAIEVFVEENGKKTTLCFSGDIGNTAQPILKDPSPVKNADYVIMESTYGNRSHGERPDYVKELAAIIQRTLDRGGNIVIPSFAVGRTQEMLYFIRKIKEQKLVKGHGSFPVYVDSPLAIEATNIFRDTDNAYQCYDEETLALVKSGVNPISFDGLYTSVTSDDSKAINTDTTGKVIISASGMCEAGRIRHHLKHNLWRKESTVLFVGYQGAGTLGRALVEGAKKVKLFGEEIAVEAEILELAGVSGHADTDGLLNWAKGFEEKPKRVFVVHGDTDSCEAFATRLRSEAGYEAYCPYSGDVWDLDTNTQTAFGSHEPIKKEESHGESGKISEPYRRLLDAAARLSETVKRHSQAANKDIAKLTDQIISLCEKWK